MGKPKSLILHYLPRISSGWLYFPELYLCYWYGPRQVLLYPFWNHWWSLQCDWLSAVWFIHESHNFLLLVTSVLNCAIIHVLTHVISVLNRAIFALYCIISVSGTKWDVKAFSFLLFNKPATWSIKYCYWLNSAFSKWL